MLSELVARYCGVSTSRAPGVASEFQLETSGQSQTEGSTRHVPASCSIAHCTASDPRYLPKLVAAIVARRRHRRPSPPPPLV